MRQIDHLLPNHQRWFRGASPKTRQNSLPGFTTITAHIHQVRWPPSPTEAYSLAVNAPARLGDANGDGDRFGNYGQGNVLADSPRVVQRLHHSVVLQPSSELLPSSRVLGTPLDIGTSPHSAESGGVRSLLYPVAKRAFDLLLALTLALIVLPLLPVIALAIKLDSPGPVFYSQNRVGRYGRMFRIHKFRSMATDAERNGAVWAQVGDPRVTHAGNFLRKSRIDELPQVWNVLRGDMTLVGPRPERPEFTSQLETALPAYADRHMVKPGLTGWAQIRYRYASSVQDSARKLDYDLYYVAHRSLLFDTRILFLTIPVILNLRGR